MARRVRILRARNFGTGLGGPGNPRDVAGIAVQTGSPRAGSHEDATQLLAFARIRARVRSTFSHTTIGSKGRL